MIAGVLGVPAGFLIAFKKFRGKRIVITILNSLLALPTVVVGLLVYALISRRGLLGILDLLYTQKAMVIGQVILIFPIVASLTIAAISRIDDTRGEIRDNSCHNRLFWKGHCRDRREHDAWR